MPSGAINPSPPRWRALSFRLPHPGWLALAAAVVVIAGLVLVFWMPAYQQQRAIRKIMRWRGNYTIENEAPEWLARRLGRTNLTIFDRLTHAQIFDAAISDTEMSHLSELRSLNFLNLSRTSVGDGGLAHISSLRTLEHLWLGGTHVGDAGLIHIRNMTTLTDLSLEGTQVTDAGLAHLSGLKKLEWLNLERTRVSRAGLDAIRKALPLCEIQY